jgi:cytochrome c oxidase assembly factor CtaG/ferredoxin
VSPLARAVLGSWTASPWLATFLLLGAGIYARGWRDLRAQMPERFPAWRLAAFLGGLAMLFVAIASPLDAFAAFLLQVHMAQHGMLMVVAPPLLLLGSPALPLLRGLPVALAKSALGPFLAWPALRRLFEALGHPIAGASALVAATWGWHVPAAYELALRSPAWHAVEHASFLAAGILFWWPVVEPWPSRRRWPRFAMVPYLLLADLQNTALAALLTFSDRVLYPAYARVPRLGDLSALDDQAAAGVLMWVPMSIAYLIPAAVITVRLLSPRREAAPVPRAFSLRTAIPPRRRFDLLAVPFVGALLRSLRFRRALQGMSLLVAIAVVLDGLLGPQMSPMNLAGVVPWTYWRGGAVVGLLALGNVFCPACPFMLPRELARRLRLPRHPWPRVLRSKWLAVGLLALFLWGSETFALWDAPAGTAWLVLGYFAAALAVDSVFRGASFCKYVCPIGQFHFVQSLASPLEVAVRRPEVCAACATHDCLRGNAQARGCELELFAPQKAGSLDCTFCLDCVRACPHDNIGILAGAPGRELVGDPARSSLGRLSRRPDIAALALLLVFGAFASAAAMVGPVTRFEADLAGRLGLASTRPVTTAAFLVALGLAPLALAGLAGALGRRLAGMDLPVWTLVCRFALALVPLGLAMWTTHFLFHLLTGWRSVLPVLQRLAPELLGPARFAMSASGFDADRLLGLELLVLDLGLLLTLAVGWRIAGTCVRESGRALGLVGPWAVLAVALWMGGVWTFLQPMQMRGLMSHG